MRVKYIYFYYGIVASLFVVVIFSCRKDKVQEPVVEDPTKWELISGDYMVYDTLGAYLYDMRIDHFLDVDSSDGDKHNYFRFDNFDGQFTFEQKQISESILSEPYINIGYHDTLYDDDGNRWKLTFASGISDDYNYLREDTILLRFDKTNINYYLQDLVPYYECECKQIAVKQN